MIIERHRLTGSWPVKRQVPKVTKIEPTNNGVNMDDSNCPDKLEPALYDTIITYCVSCKARIDIPIIHDNASNNYYQLVNIPDFIADEVHNQKVYCKQCRNTNLLEKQKQVTNLNVFTLKLDCSNMNPGTEDWYEDFSSSSGDGHPRKF